jgi:hypothetical protein
VRIVKITAKFDEDEKQYIVIVGRQCDDGRLDKTSEHYGYVYDWSDPDKGYYQYPFLMEQFDDSNGLLDWGGWDTKTKSIVDVFARRIVPGEKLHRSDDGERSAYTIANVVSLL